MNAKYIACVVAALTAVLAHPSYASSDEAWQELETKMTAACLKASDLDAAKVKWSSLDFETKTTALVTGKWRAKSVKGRKAAVLCVYDKQTGRAEIQEFDVRLLK